MTPIGYLFAAVWIGFILYLAYRYCTGYSRKGDYTRPSTAPKDGFDAAPMQRGREVSYMPAREGGSKGGLPISALGKSGRGRLGAKQAKEDE
jgi:hypothetical protein